MASAGYDPIGRGFGYHLLEEIFRLHLKQAVDIERDWAYFKKLAIL
jgi:hypothetical protein